MLREGVFTANGGPVLYRERELKTFQEAWNNKPIVLEHPTNKNGDFVTATTADILEKTQVGFVLNSRWDGKLKADAWIDIELLREKAPAILANIENGTPNEVSTGLVVDQRMKKGRFSGKPYSSIATAYRPDHLALLSGSRGACSLADGAGLMVMQEGVSEELRKEASLALDKMVANQLTHSRIREMLSAALVKWSVANGKGYLWIEDVSASFVIFRTDGKLWQLGYKSKGEVITLNSGDPVEIQSVTQYRLVDGTVVANNSTEKEEPVMKKKAMVEFLLANSEATGWEADDRAVLSQMSEDKLKNLVKPHTALLSNTKGDDEDEDDEDDEPAKKPAKKAKRVVSNEDESCPKAFDYDAWMKGAPKSVRRGIQFAQSLMNQQVAGDIKTIVDLSDGAYTEEDCKTMSPVALKKLATVVSNAAAKAKTKATADDSDEDDFEDEFNFSGAAGFMMGNRLGGSRDNSEDDAEDAPLGLAKSSFVPSGK
jgi:hypothetical protein